VLRDAVFFDFEIFRREARDEATALVEDAGIDLHDLGTRLKRRRLLRRRWLLREQRREHDTENDPHKNLESPSRLPSPVPYFTSVTYSSNFFPFFSTNAIFFASSVHAGRSTFFVSGTVVFDP
jgi:hypothetical protein